MQHSEQEYNSNRRLQRCCLEAAGGICRPFHARLVAEGSAQALGEELAQLEDAGLQLVGADGRGGAGDRLGAQLRPPPGTASQHTERRTSVVNRLN